MVSQAPPKTVYWTWKEEQYDTFCKIFKTYKQLYRNMHYIHSFHSPVSRSVLTACSSMLSGIQVNMPNKATSRRRIQCRWQLVYTLVNNPSLLGSRKHFQTLKTSEITLNGTPNRSSSKGSMKEAATPAAEPVQSTEAPTNQDKTEWSTFICLVCSAVYCRQHLIWKVCRSIKMSWRVPNKTHWTKI